MLALGVASPLAVLSLLGASAAVGQTAKLGLSPGVHHEGVPVAVVVSKANGETAPHGLALRRGCQWGQPGRQPYQGSVRQALQAAGLPADVIAQIEDQHRSGRKSGRLAISRSGIRHTGDGRVFPARGIALTYGMTLCQGATVNFARGHVEMADLYEARDAQGKPHAVMVPDVCGNVSVLGAAGAGGARGAVAGVSATLARRAQALAELAEVLDPQSARPGAAAGQAPVAAPGSSLSSDARPSAGTDSGGADAGAGDVAADGDPNATPGATSGTTSDTTSGTAPVTSRQSAWPLLLGGGTPSTQVGGGGGASPVALTVLAAATDLLIPPAAAATVARGVSQATAAAGRGLETLAVGTGSGGGVGGAGGGGTAGNAGEPQQVPEPGSLALSLLALVLLAWRMRRRR